MNGDRDSAFFGIGFGHFSRHQLKVDNFQSFEIEQTRIFDSDDEARLVDSLFRRYLYKISRNGFHKMFKKVIFEMFLMKMIRPVFNGCFGIKEQQS